MNQKQIMSVALSLIILFIGCAKEQPVEPKSADSIKLTPAELTFEAVGGEQTITLNANAEWKVSEAPDWCKVTPTSGQAGEKIIVTINAGDNAADKRDVKLMFTAGSASAELAIKQEETSFRFETVEMAGLVWIDRNMNATSTNFKDEWIKTIGAYYQWGRNIAFMDTITYKAVNGPLPMAEIAVNLGDEGTKDFVAVSDKPYIWSKEKNDDLWKTKSPCPKGYRVPTSAEFLTIMPIDFTRGRWGFIPKALPYEEAGGMAHYFASRRPQEISVHKTLWSIKKQGSADAYFMRWEYVNYGKKIEPEEGEENPEDRYEERYVMVVSYWKGNATDTFFKEDGETTKEQPEIEAMYAALGNPASRMYYPAASVRAAESGKAPVNFYSGSYWASDIDVTSTNGDLANMVNFGGTGVYMNADYRATAANVRCIRE